jgi:hypothetical protein
MSAMPAPAASIAASVSRAMIS